jgi:hypothetical protein
VGCPALFYSIGNDRITVSYPCMGAHLPKSTSFLLFNGLAQLNDVDTDVYISVEYVWLPGSPAGYKNVLAISQDTTNGKSHPPKGQSFFVLTARPMAIQRLGKILSQHAGDIFSADSVKAY